VKFTSQLSRITNRIKRSCFCFRYDVLEVKYQKFLFNTSGVGQIDTVWVHPKRLSSSDALRDARFCNVKHDSAVIMHVLSPWHTSQLMLRQAFGEGGKARG